MCVCLTFAVAGSLPPTVDAGGEGALPSGLTDGESTVGGSASEGGATDGGGVDQPRDSLREFLRSLPFSMSDERIEELRGWTIEELSAEFEPLGLVVPESARRAAPSELVVNVLSAREMVEVLVTQNVPTGVQPSEAEVDFLVTTYGTGRAEAERWLTTIAEVQPFVMASRYELGDQWVAWGLDHPAQQVEVQVRSAPAAEAALRTLNGFDNVRVTVVKHSMAEIAAGVEAVAAALRGEVEAGRIADLPFLVHESFEQNRIVLVVSPDLAESDARLQALALDVTGGIEVEVRREQVGTLIEERCSTPSTCEAPLRGNLHLTGEGCTSGFVFRSGNTLRGSTAGHCNDGYDDVWQTMHGSSGIRTVGSTTHDTVQADNMDVLLFDIDDRRDWYPLGAVLRQGDNAAPVTGEVVQGAAGYNAPVCKGGRTTAANTGSADTCGILTDQYANSSMANNLGLIESCTHDGGDSGAPVYSSGTATLAMGIHRGGAGSSCYFTWTSDVTALWGYQVLINSPLPARGDIMALPPTRVAASIILPAGLQYAVNTGQWVPAGSSGMVANVTVRNPASGGYLQIWRSGDPVPFSSSMNWIAGQSRGSLTVLPIGTAPGFTYFKASTTVEIIIDRFGYLAAPALSLATWVRDDPVRTHDVQCTTAGCTISFPIDKVPDGSTAVLANITVVSPSSNGWVTVTPAGSTTDTSLINMQTGRTISNLAIVKLNSAEDIVVTPVWVAGTPPGTTARVLVDVLGYVRAETQADRGLTYNATPPERRFDATVASGTITIEASLDLTQTEAPRSVVLPTADAILVNVTGSNPPGNGYCTVYRSSPLPGTSNVNFNAGVSVNANHAITAATYDPTQSFNDQHARFNFYCNLGPVRRIIDTVGYLD